MNGLARLVAANGLVNAGNHAADARLGNGTGAKKLDHENLFHRAIPVLIGPAAQVAAADDACLVVVGSEVGGSGVRDIDGDEGNVGFQVLAGDGRSDGLIRLKLDHQI